MMMYLEGEEPSIDDMKKALRRATMRVYSSSCIPWFSLQEKGVQKMLDGVVEYMPAPTDIPHITGVDPMVTMLFDILQMKSHSQHLHSRL